MRPVISDLGIERAAQRQRFLQPFEYDDDNIIWNYFNYYFIMYTSITESNRGIRSARLLDLVNASAWLYVYRVWCIIYI